MRVSLARISLPCHSRLPPSHQWEVDRFEGRHEGLVSSEIEIDDEAAGFERPEWLGPEVTGDAAYYNATLSSRD